MKKESSVKVSYIKTQPRASISSMGRKLQQFLHRHTQLSLSLLVSWQQQNAIRGNISIMYLIISIDFLQIAYLKTPFKHIF